MGSRSYPIKAECEIKDIIFAISFDELPYVTSILNGKYFNKTKKNNMTLHKDYRSFFVPRFSGSLKPPLTTKDSGQSGQQTTVHNNNPSINENDIIDSQNINSSQTTSQSQNDSSDNPEILETTENKLIIATKCVYVQSAGKTIKIPIKAVPEAWRDAPWIPDTREKRLEFWFDKGFYQPFNIFNKITDDKYQFFVTKLEDWEIDTESEDSKIASLMKQLLDKEPPYSIGYVLHDANKTDTNSLTGMNNKIIVMKIVFFFRFDALHNQ